MKSRHLTPLFLFSFFVHSANAQSNFIGSGIDLQFSGSSNSYVNFGDVYNNLNFPFTIETWLKLKEYPPIHGAIFFSDNSAGNYYGIYLDVESTGVIRIEFGNGIGAGSQFRRGYFTSHAVPLNKWMHIAVSCTSDSIINICFNGVSQLLTQTNGGSTTSNLVHSSDPASIGWGKDQFGEYPLNGQLDEIRLWNVARSETQTRNNMCQKLAGTESGLIGYWTADESYTSDTVLDHTVPTENGNIVGTVNKLTSGAPIGNTSVNLFTTSWKGVSLSLGSPGKDKFAVKTVKNNPYGILIYRVDTIPYSTTGLNQYPNYYFGVFIADSTSEAKYNVNYHYSFKNGIVNSGNQSSCSLFKRTDGSDLVWVNANASLNTNSKQLSLVKEAGRNEYILNINNTDPETELRAQKNDANISIYPNPFSNQLTINWSGKSGEIFVMNCEGQMIYSGTIVSSGTTLNTSAWGDGIYLVMLKDERQTYTRKIVLGR